MDKACRPGATPLPLRGRDSREHQRQRQTRGGSLALCAHHIRAQDELAAAGLCPLEAWFVNCCTAAQLRQQEPQGNQPKSPPSITVRLIVVRMTARSRWMDDRPFLQEAVCARSRVYLLFSSTCHAQNMRRRWNLPPFSHPARSPRR